MAKPLMYLLHGLFNTNVIVSLWSLKQTDRMAVEISIGQNISVKSIIAKYLLIFSNFNNIGYWMCGN